MSERAVVKTEDILILLAVIDFHWFKSTAK